MIDQEIFNDVPLFSLLDLDERQVLAQQVSLRTFAKGETIFKAGDKGGYAYLVQSGLIHVSIVDIANDVIVVDVVDQDGLVGMSSMMAESPHLTTAVAVEDTEAIEIDREDLKALLLKKPLAGLDIMTMIEKQLRAAHELMRTRVSRNPNEEIEDAETLGDRMADNVARFGGSWRFVILFGITLLVYVILNIFMKQPWDPYPFILLNLFLSMLAALQAPVIMMSQNRQDKKDRVRNDLDYRVNFKAELEIEEILQRIGHIEQKVYEQARKRN